MMIEKGAFDWNYGLKGANEGEHNDLAIMMIEKGADIDNSTLNNDDILFLLHRGVKRFGKYTKIKKMWNKWLQLVAIELKTIFIADLADIIMTY